jgi:oxygen-independent coproporphyrinogen-3 oxidase
MIRAPFSLYVHVPFCAHKCPYCDFNTYAVSRVPEKEYVEAVCTELQSYREDPRFRGRPVGTVFFGGGTPSLLSAEAIRTIVHCTATVFGILEKSELTLEANPRDAERVKLEALREAGINRLSFGVQSFHDGRLQLLGRDHSSHEASQAIESAASAGFTNISLDIIFGVPEQTVEQLESDLRQALCLPIQHLSTYSLTIEPGTPFYQRQARGLLAMPPDEGVAQMLERIPEVASNYGFERYEISNYARPRYQSAHNMVYWSGGDYLGVGAGAHSYYARFGEAGAIESAERWSTLALPASYVDGVRRGAAVSWRESLDREALIFEFFYLGMRRTMLGVSRIAFQNLFTTAIPAGIEQSLDALRHDGFVEFDGDVIRLTDQGIALADSVFERLSGV